MKETRNPIEKSNIISQETMEIKMIELRETLFCGTPLILEGRMLMRTLTNLGNINLFLLSEKLSMNIFFKKDVYSETPKFINKMEKIPNTKKFAIKKTKEKIIVCHN